MRIAINMAGFFGDDDWNEQVKTLFKQMANNWPKHQFVFITGHPVTVAENITNIILADPAKNGLSLKLWYDYKLPSLLQKQQVDLLIHAAGVCSLRCKIPQILLVKDEAALKVGFVKKRWQQSLNKAQSIVVFDEAMQTKLLQQGVAKEKITTSHFFANHIFQPIDWQIKESIKAKHSDSKEFFLCHITKNAADPLVLLKAFSLFKKRQQSNMQLLLVSENEKSSRFLADKLSNYKYRTEVKLLNALPANEMAELLAAAYCVLYFDNASLGLPLANAMQCGVPFIILQTILATEMQVNTALHANAQSPEAVAEQLKIIYKDENLRSRIIAAGYAIAQNNTVENAAIKMETVLSALELSH
jgi:glycosyltransferase involved in cell wall biosynthesis